MVVQRSLAGRQVCKRMQKEQISHELPPKLPSESLNSIAFHIVLTFLFVEFTFFLCSRILVLLVFRDQVIHIAFCLSELHLVHSLSCVPMKESLAAEHGCEVLSHAFEHFLDSCGIAKERHCHLQTLW